MKNKLVRTLSVITCILFIASGLTSCESDKEPPPAYAYTETDRDITITFGKTESVNNREGYDLTVTRLSVAVDGKPDLSQEINTLLDEWLRNGLNQSDRLWDTLSAYDNERTFSLSNFVSFNSNGILSLVCRLEYREYGELFSYVLDSCTWDLGRGDAISVTEMLPMNMVDYENFLTMNFEPLISAAPERFPASLVEAAGKYSEHIEYYVTKKGVTLYIHYKHMDYQKSYLEHTLEFKSNPGMFGYDLEIVEEQ